MRSYIGVLLKRAALLCVAIASLMQSAFACGPWFPQDFFVYGGRDYKKMPPAWFPSELYHLNGIAVAAAAATPEVKTCDLTVDTELVQLGAALREAGRQDPEAAEILEAYRLLRCAMLDPERRIKEWEERWKQQFVRGWHEDPSLGPQPGEPPLFDLSSHEALLSRLPEQFALYVRGAALYRGREYERAQPFFEEIMSLPPANRSHMELAATYMLGVTYLRLKRYDRAIASFDRVDKLVAEGTANPLGFATATAGWRGKVHYEQGDWVAAAKYYLDVCSSGNQAQQNAAMLSLRWTFSKIDPDKHAEQLEAILWDERVRKALIAWSLVNPTDSWKVRDWLLPRLETLPGPIPYADRIAWLAYNGDDMKGAKRWADMAEPGSAIASWVRAKLFLHDGDMDAAIAALSQVIEEGEKSDAAKDPAAPEWKVYVETVNDGIIEFEPLNLGAQAKAELSTVWVAKKPKTTEEWKLALENLSMDDQVHLAEREMTTEELRGYVRKHEPPREDDNSVSDDYRSGLRQALARRLVREGRIEEAAEFFVEPAKGAALRLVQELQRGRDMSLPSRIRAQHLMEAAHLTIGGVPYETLQYPDWQTGLPFATYLYQVRAGSGINANAGIKEPPRRFNEKFIAADLMWEAAALLPDNDPLTAEALYEGGFPIKYEDPKVADKFYRALVRRNPNLAIAREAKKLHWFPKEFNDRVLYTSLPRRFITRARAEMLLAAAAVLGVIAAAGGALVLRKRRRTPALDGSEQ